MADMTIGLMTIILLLELVYTFLLAGSMVFPAAVVCALAAGGLHFTRMRGARWVLPLFYLVFVLLVRQCLVSADFLPCVLVCAELVQVACCVLMVYGGKESGAGNSTVVTVFSAACMAPVYLSYRQYSGVPQLPGLAIGTTILALAAVLMDQGLSVSALRIRKAGLFGISWIRASAVLGLVSAALILGIVTAPRALRVAGPIRSCIFAEPVAAGMPGVAQPRPGSAGSVALSMEGEMNVPHDVEFHVQVRSRTAREFVARNALYVRVGGLDRFEGRTWSQSDRETRIVHDADDGEEDGNIRLGLPGRYPITYTVYTRFRQGGRMPAIPAVAGICLPSVMVHADDIYSAPVRLGVTRFAYSMSSEPVVWAEIAKTRLRVGVAPGRYSALEPCILSEKIREESHRITGASSSVEAIRVLLEYFHSEFEYSRKVTNPRKFHPVENFLFHERRGPCNLFATSFVLMLRARGIPARLGLGYVGGEYDVRQRLFTFYSDNAHAWAEVFLEEYGWVVIDPVPPDADLATPAGGSGPRISLSSYPPLESLVSSGLTGISGRERAGLRAADLLLLVVNGVLLAAVVAALSIVRLMRATRTTSSRTFLASAAEPGFFRLFCRHFAAAGYPIRRGQTPREYLLELKRTGLAGDEHESMILYLYSISYEGGPRDSSYERRVRHLLRSHQPAAAGG